MGLFYILPTDKKDHDRIKVQKNNSAQVSEYSITLKSYGPPQIFWIYLILTLALLLIMYVTIGPSLDKILQGKDIFDILIGYGTYSLFFVIPVFLLGIFFYEKRITKSNKALNIKHYLFFIPIYSKNITLNDNNWKFTIKHFTGTPNIAKKEELNPAHFNKGYYNLFLERENKEHFIDRSSLLNEIKKVKKLLTEIPT